MRLDNDAQIQTTDCGKGPWRGALEQCGKEKRKKNWKENVGHSCRGILGDNKVIQNLQFCTLRAASDILKSTPDH